MPKHGENIRKRKDGRWEGRYIKYYNEKNRAVYTSVYAMSYQDVKKKLNDIFQNQEALEKKQEEREDILYQDVLMQWLEMIQIKIKPQTYFRYYQLISHHIIPALGSYSIRKLALPDIHKFIHEKLKRGKLNRTGGLSFSTVKMILYIVKASVNYARTMGQCLLHLEDISLPKEAAKKIQILSKEEQLRLEDYLYSKIDASKLGILLCLYTGLRLGEVCGMLWSDVDFERRVVCVRRTVQRLSNLNKEAGTKTSIMFGAPKSSSSLREIPLPSFLIPDLKAEMKRAEKNSYILSGRYDHFVEPRTYEYRLKSYLKAAGIESIRFHALRHTFATRCIELGFDAKTLCEILGHANVHITLSIYVHSSLELKRSQMELLALLQK